MGGAGKICINYAGILFWNANCNSKTWASSHKLHGKASVKRKKFVSPVQHHKAGCDRTSFICAWQGKIGWVAAERTRAATSHFVIFRALKLYLVGSLTCLRGGRSPKGSILFIRLGEGSGDFGCVTIKFAWSPIRLYNTLLISPREQLIDGQFL